MKKVTTVILALMMLAGVSSMEGCRSTIRTQTITQGAFGTVSYKRRVKKRRTRAKWQRMTPGPRKGGYNW